MCDNNDESKTIREFKKITTRDQEMRDQEIVGPRKKILFGLWQIFMPDKVPAR